MGVPTSANPLTFDKPAPYLIRVSGQLDSSWSDRLEDMRIRPPKPEDSVPVTELVGELPDQAALIGVLNTLYDLHLTLLSVECISGR